MEEGKKAVDFARKVIEQKVKADKISISDLQGIFDEKQGAFVTIHTHPNHDLRGCIGIPLPVMPLKNAITEGAQSATRDPRFPPLSENELDKIIIEVTILTKPEEITVEKPEYIDAAQLRPGKRVSLSVRPEKISIHRTLQDLPNVLSGVVSGIFFLGVEQKIKVEMDDKFDLMVRVQEIRDSQVCSQGERVQVGWGKEAGNIFL